MAKRSRGKSKQSLSKKLLEYKKPIFLCVIAVLILLLSGFYYVQSQDKPRSTSTAADTSEEKTTDESAASNTQASETTPNTPPATTPSNPTPKPNVPFQISKVYFSQAPKAPNNAGFGQCTVGQVLTYVASVDVTATAAGTMTYHWGTADHLSGANDSHDNETYQFKSAGKATISKTLSYTAHETPGYGDKLWNRQYINLFVSSPNETYANIDTPMFASGSRFIWGTYIDLC